MHRERINGLGLINFTLNALRYFVWAYLFEGSNKIYNGKLLQT